MGDLDDKDNIRISRSSISRRAGKLAGEGLLIAIGNGVYDITEEGEVYLEGEYDAENHVYQDGNSEENGPVAGEEPGET